MLLKARLKSLLELAGRGAPLVSTLRGRSKVALRNTMTSGWRWHPRAAPCLASGIDGRWRAPQPSE
eukprot:scaffold93433_cov32-Tisochrysis_lutea.AAC.4